MRGTYQRLIDICLSGLPASRIVAYLDDIVIFSKSFSEHVADRECVFERLSKAKISLRPEKCLLASNEVDFLGYNLSEIGIKPRAELVNAIKMLKQPKSKKGVKIFLGTVGFCRNFIENFADISLPLRELTKESAKFI